MTFAPYSHHLSELSIPTITHVFSNSQSLTLSMQNTMYCRMADALIATKYYLAANMARDREIMLSYILTAEMLADCLTNPLLKPTFLKLWAAMGMISNGLRNGIGIAFGIGNGNRNAVGKSIDWGLMFEGDPGGLISCSSSLFTVLFEMTVLAVLEECWADCKYR